MLNLQIVRARPDQRPLIEGLFQLYIYDFSQFAAADAAGFDVDDQGRFPPTGHLDGYWSDPARIPLLILVDGHTAGFALINDWAPSGGTIDHAVAEFFVLRKYRRLGVGTLALAQILARYPGRWELAIAERNTPALAFWPRAVAAAANVADISRIEGDRVRWRGPILRFLANPPSEP